MPNNQEFNTQNALEAYNSTRIRITDISKDKLTILQKHKLIRDELNYFKSIEADKLPLNIKGKIYLFAFKRRLVNIIMLLEYIQHKKLKKYIPIAVIKQLQYTFSRSKAYDHLEKKAKKMIVTLAADYGNLGDVAITHAQIKFLNDNFPEYLIVELPISRTYKDLKSLKKKVTEADIITMVGGGNTGNLYEGIEQQRRFIIRKFRKNKIISFPQSVYFSPDSEGRKSLKRSIKTYKRHGNLILFARDEPSLIFMKDKFISNKILAAPDIVLYLNEVNTKLKRKAKTITLALREDKESSLSQKKKQALVEELTERGYNIIHQDTNLGDLTMNSEQKISELKKLWNIFGQSEIVITDRLHGLIFCVITNTPCIAINNNNGKVSSLYKKWLSNIENVCVLNKFDIDSIIRLLSTLPGREQNIMSDDIKNKILEIANAIR